MTSERLAEGQALWNSIFALSERLTGDPLACLDRRQDEHGQEL
jgi:hypothetical protein